MLDQIQPILPDDTDPYATTEEILAVQDLPGYNVKIARWHANGKPLKLRVRGLDLPTQDKINQACLVKNPKTGLWEQSRVLLAVETLQVGIRVPEIDAGTARAMLQKNPVVINALVDFIWALAAFTDAMLEKAAHALLDADAAAALAASAAAGPENEPVAADGG